MRIFKRINGYAKALKEGRCQLIRDGASHQEWAEILVQKANGKHSESITQSVEMSFKIAVLGEVIINEMGKSLESDIEALPISIGYKFQKKLLQVRAAENEPEEKVLDVPAGGGCGKRKYIDSLFEE